jgi:hypothetical protein
LKGLMIASIFFMALGNSSMISRFATISVPFLVGREH